MGIAFDHEALGHVHAAIGGHAPDIVAAKIEQHEMLGDLFLVGQQVGGAPGVFLSVARARARAGNRADRDAAGAHAHQDLRTGPNQLHLAHMHMEHERRRV